MNDIKLTSDKIGKEEVKKLRQKLLEDFLHTFTDGHSDAALAASVFHFGEIPIPQLKQYLNKEGVSVRL